MEQYFRLASIVVAATIVLVTSCASDQQPRNNNATADVELVPDPVVSEQASVSSSQNSVSRSTPDRFAEAMSDFPYSNFNQVILHADLVAKGRISDVVAGRENSVGINRRFAVEVQKVFRGPDLDKIFLEDDSWIEGGLTYGFTGSPWLVEGDEIYLVAFQINATDGLYAATHAFGATLDSSPVDRSFDGVSTRLDAAGYEDRIAEAIEAINAGKVEFVTPEEELALQETWTAKPKLYASASDAKAIVWELWAAPTQVGFCYDLVPAGSAMRPGTGCFSWPEIDQFASAGPVTVPLPTDDIGLILAMPTQRARAIAALGSDSDAQVIDVIVPSEDGERQLTVIMDGVQ